MLALLVSTLLGGLELEAGNRVPPPPAPLERLRIVTFNVEYGRDVPRLADAIWNHPALRHADVLLLQEMRSYPAEGRSRTERLAEALGLSWAYAPARPTGDGGTHGPAILSRYPLSSLEVIPLRYIDLHVGAERRVALAATVDVPGGPLRLYDLHLDTRINPRDRASQLRPVAERALRDSFPHVVVGGDLNTNPLRWLAHLVPIFGSRQAAAADQLMRGLGFDAPLARSGGTLRAFPFGIRLDTMYVRGLQVEHYRVEHLISVSDHWPVWMDIQWPPE